MTNRPCVTCHLCMPSVEFRVLPRLSDPMRFGPHEENTSLRPASDLHAPWSHVSMSLHIVYLDVADPATVWRSDVKIGDKPGNFCMERGSWRKAVLRDLSLRWAKSCDSYRRIASESYRRDSNC